MSRYDVDWDEMEDLAVVAPFFDELRTQFAEGPAPQIGTELATLFVFGAPPVGVVKPAPTPSSRGRTVRRVAAGAVGGLALVAGMGAAGALPAPIQEPVANAAKFVGLNLPHPHHHRHPTPHQSDHDTGTGGTSEVTTHAHRATHVPSGSTDGSTVVNPDGSTNTSGATADQPGTTGKKTGSGSSTTTGNSVVTGSGSAVSSTGGSGSGSGDHGTNGSNQHQRPTYHGNGRTTRSDPSTSTSTTTPPSDSGSGSGSGSGGPSTSTPPDTTPTTTPPSS